MAYVFNTIDPDSFNVGDTVVVATDYTTEALTYEVRVLRVLEGEDAGGLQRHYLVYVATHIEDRLEVYEARCCYRSEEQFEQLAKEAKRRNKVYREKLQQAVTAAREAFDKKMKDTK